MAPKLDTKKTNSKMLRRVTIILLAASLLLTVAVSSLMLIPIETVRVGDCGSQIIRISLAGDGRERIEQAKLEAERRTASKDYVLRTNPGLVRGCSIGPTYKLYTL